MSEHQSVIIYFMIIAPLIVIISSPLLKRIYRKLIFNGYIDNTKYGKNKVIYYDKKDEK